MHDDHRLGIGGGIDFAGALDAVPVRLFDIVGSWGAAVQGSCLFDSGGNVGADRPLIDDSPSDQQLYPAGLSGNFGGRVGPAR
jgi:hypothetical protein